MACRNDDDDEKVCKCSEQRWERTSIHPMGQPTVIISSTEWVKVGNSQSIEETGCELNGGIKRSGNSNTVIIPGTDTYRSSDYEYRITCN